ncbi:glycosyl hydrolase family 18 [Colletotrichum salicis]|uniref:chitinase n=1 Tax=Colletotrichum salicis TaxID=1209931 RepID=A0A135UJE8_9PEZI|nr:glycosyl hydrolase family 18 [Colletotrichum salicis]
MLAIHFWHWADLECGYEEDHCGSDCVSDCDSKADCGAYADPPGKECPLRVCCNKWGNCGTTESFCGDGCQSNCEVPGVTTGHDGDVRDLVVGYFESWILLRRGCSQRDITHIRIDSMTHINVAFGFIKPDTYEIHPIRGATIAGFQNVTNLKQRAPGLKVWLALGGWTFSDNGTDTQPVFGDISSTALKRSQFVDKLLRFMTEQHAHRVDIDWEYPGAPDRGGQTRDIQNFVLLMKDIWFRFQADGKGLGVSFTAPTSYWYMRWFDIGAVMPYVDWVNLMTYDIHGSWDEDSDWIGPYVYAHTNLTEIKHGLDLLWRNGVPANKVNLGLAFYGRTYKLEDPDCDTPGCPFADPGTAGQCSVGAAFAFLEAHGTGGYMSYQDIEYTIDSNSPTPIYDEKEKIMYFKYRGDQWVSYDNEKTIREKVEFANDLGLRGLFIWAIDQDNLDNDLLNAVLQPDGLGKFKKRNGVGADGSDWKKVDLDGRCFWSGCEDDCPTGTNTITTVRCARRGNSKAKDPMINLCCPLANSPDPETCRWSAPNLFWGLICESTNSCDVGEERIITSQYYINDKGEHDACLEGDADYCCKIQEGGTQLCEWDEGNCIEVDQSEILKPKPKGNDPCGTGKKFTTFRKGKCKKNRWESLCCDTNIDTSSCRWRNDMNDRCNPECHQNEVKFGTHVEGGGRNCEWTVPGSQSINNMQGQKQIVWPGLCCDSEAFKVELKSLPVPLENLFPDADDIPESDEQSFGVEVDPTMGGRKSGSGSDNPNLNSFGWHIMSGPEEQISSIDKRDGSHWEVFDCDEEFHDGRQHAKLVCTDESEDSNCATLFKGGVPNTVLEMPDHCGPGKYALAVDIDLVNDDVPVTLPRLVKRKLQKRGMEFEKPKVYNLTFDYDYSVLQGRQDNKVRLRVDYSDNPGYWNDIVASPPGKTKRDVAMEVDEEHGGSWESYLEHRWRIEKRSTPENEKHLLHERWFSLWAVDWINKQKEVDLDYDLVRHSVRETFVWNLFRDSKSCPNMDVSAHIWTELTVNVDTSAVISLIGDLSNLKSFDQSHATFRNKGDVEVSFNFVANAELRFSTGPAELAGLAPLGASFKIPGILTCGPQFRLIGELNGKASIDANARISYKVAKWDFMQQYPPKEEWSDPFNPDKKDKADLENEQRGKSNSTKPQFSYNLHAEGMVEAIVTPMITFGIVFNSELGVPNAAIDMGVEASARLWGSGGTSNTIAWEYCYGAEAHWAVFGRASAPTLFNIPLSRRWDLASDTIDIIPSQCGSSED